MLEKMINLAQEKLIEAEYHRDYYKILADEEKDEQFKKTLRVSVDSFEQKVEDQIKWLAYLQTCTIK
jgi:hypothetical protein